MILIADSGSTKTAWRLLFEDGHTADALTAGFNPQYQNSDNIRQELQEKLLPQLLEHGTPTAIFFYGAGCSTPTRAAKVEQALQAVFPMAQVLVQHDLLAAARALCGRETGIACILGTGTNSCFYNGSEIIDYPISLGFWLGDEGSGGYLGKELLKQYLNGDLPEHLQAKMAKRYPWSKNEIIDKIYGEPFPNRFCASFSKFLFDNRKDPHCYAMVQEAFRQFFQRFVERYDGYQQQPVHVLGSVGFYFSDILRRIAKERGINLQRVVQTPVAGLTLYHREELGW